MDSCPSPKFNLIFFISVTKGPGITTLPSHTADAMITELSGAVLLQSKPTAYHGAEAEGKGAREWGKGAPVAAGKS